MGFKDTSYRVGETVICHKNVANIKSRKEYVGGLIVKIKEFQNSFGWNDYTCTIQFEDNTIRELLVREILCKKST